MELAAKLDDIGKPAWIALLVLGFIVFWPVGLALLAFLIWSGRMGFWSHDPERWQRRIDRLHSKMERFNEKAGRWHGARHSRPSGNRAFDEYRDETLRRLEDEQREFFEFLERLRHAKDRAEFDEFMSERGRRPEGPAPSSPPA
jgi:hypothetical protein